MHLKARSDSGLRGPHSLSSCSIPAQGAGTQTVSLCHESLVVPGGSIVQSNRKLSNLGTQTDLRVNPNPAIYLRRDLR